MKEQEIHNKNIEKSWTELVNKDIEELIIPFKSNFIKASTCPCCNSNSLKFEFEFQSLEYDSCKYCNLLFINPFPNEELKTNYIINSKALEMWRVEIPKVESRNKLYEERVDFMESYILNYFEKNKKKITLLEIGAGNGELIKIILERFDDIIEEIIIIEPQILKIESPKIKYFSGIFNTKHAQNLEKYVDIVIAFEVLEHILYPQEFFKNVNLILKPNALFILSTPNAFSLETLLNNIKSRNIGFDHVRLFNPKSIEILGNLYNLNSLEISTPGKLDAEILINSNVLFEDDIVAKVVEKTKAIWLFDYIQSLKNSTINIEDFQNMIIKTNLSGHMKCIFTKSN